MKLEDDLGERLRRLAGPPAGEPPLREIAARGRRRRGIRATGLALAISLVVAGTAASLVALTSALSGERRAPAWGPSVPQSQPSVPTPSVARVPPRGPVPKPHPVPTRLVTANSDRLVVEAPPGRVGWTLTSTACSVSGVTIAGKRDSGGFGGGGCGGNPYLGAGEGGLRLHDPWYSVPYGRTAPVIVVTVRVTLWSGQVFETRPLSGLWMLVLTCSEHDPGCDARKIQAIGTDGSVLATARFPHRPRPSAPGR